MKFNSVAFTLATAGSLVAAQHNHNHHHHRRAPDGTNFAAEPGATVFAYVLNGQAVSQDVVCKGIADGTLAFAEGAVPAGVCQEASSSSASVAATSTSASAPTSSSAGPAGFFEASFSFSSSIAASSTLSVSVPSASATSSSSSSGAKGLDAEFPDGEIDCDTFPSDYGAVPLEYLGLQGWSGIQYVSIVGELVSEIITAITGDKCTDGAMCSYACPAGYQKSQWPSTQGATGQSVGGLQCKGGKLYLTNPSLSKKLCVPGVGGVNVKNTLGDSVAVCRTDYPGTESETIPLNAVNGEIIPLTCPDGETYFKWQGKTTSAQYYVNPKGYSTEDACQWGTSGIPIGNWAPLNLGVGQNNGKWLSLFQNSPTTTTKLDFNVKIEGDNLSGSCKYENGVFIDEAGSNESGCTVEVLSGSATYVFY